MAKNKGMVHGTDAERGTATEGRKKTECPLTKKRFLEKAVALAVKVGDATLIAPARSFSTGSFGFQNNEKLVIVVDGVPIKVQCNVLLTVVGSKEAAAE
jgi:hypothetical protein